MLKKLIAIALVTNLGMRYLPEKYAFVNVGNPQTAETTNGEIDASANKKPTVSTLPEMSGIEDKITQTTPVSNVILEEAPMVSVSEPKESTNPITPQNDLPTAEIWFTFDQETNTITGYSDSTEAPKNVNIPSTIGGVPVYNIANNAFVEKHLTGLILPNGLKTIGVYTFCYNPGIVGTLVIPDSVTSIDYRAFYYTGLTGVTIGSGMTTIAFDAFENCSNLTRIDISSKNDGEISSEPWGAYKAGVYWKDTKQVGNYLYNTTTNKISKYMGSATTLSIPSMLIVDGINYEVYKIGGYAFCANQTLINISIPDRVTSIGDYAFAYCSGLTGFIIPNNVTSIGKYAFLSCEGLTSVMIGNSVTSIGSDAFNSCSSLIGVTIPNSVTSIGSYAFYRCSGLTKVTIPDSVISIGYYAFNCCTGLTSITIPDSVTSIDYDAFSNCSSLTQAVISKNLNSMDSSVFYNTPALQTIYMRASRAGLPSSITSAQPWGAPASTKVWYAGEYVTFDHTVKKVTGKYNRILNIRAFMNKPDLINRIILPNGTIKFIGKSDWPDETGYYPYGSITEEAITSNGTYIFKGYGDENVENSYAVEINDIGVITLRANEAWITELMALTISEQDVLDLLNVSAEDDAGVLISGTDCTFWISPEDMTKIHALRLGNVVTIRVNVKSSRSGQEMTSYQDVTLNTTPCFIHADNVELWPPQITNLTKEQLLDLMNPSVTVSEGIVDMTKLVMSDEDFNKIKTGIIGTYNVLLTYDTNKSKKQVRVTIMDDSPSALINIPSAIKMNTIENDPVYGVGAEETVSIQATAVSYYPQSFKIETNPSFWLKSTAPDATVFNRMKVVVLDANDQPLQDNKLLATLSSSTIQSAPFKLRGYHNEWNSVGTYRGIMDFTITYGDSTP